MAPKGAAGPSKQSQADTQTNPYAPLPFTLDQGPGLPAALPAFPSNGMIPFNGGPNEALASTSWELGLSPQHNDTYNVTLEHAFPYRITASIGYVGNMGHHLWDNIDVNAPVPGPDVNGSFNPNRPYFASYGWTQEEYQRNDQLPGYPELKSNYNSLQARVGETFPWRPATNCNCSSSSG